MRKTTLALAATMLVGGLALATGPASASTSGLTPLAPTTYVMMKKGMMSKKMMMRKSMNKKMMMKRGMMKKNMM